MKANRELADKVLSEAATQLVRESHIAGTVVFVNGLSGNGKTMMAPILGSLARPEARQESWKKEK